MSGLFGGGSNSGIGGGLPSGVKLAAVALLAHQLMKHAQTERGADDAAPMPGGGGGGGGGLGGLLGGLLGQGGSAPTGGGFGASSGGGLAGMLGGLLGGGALSGGLGGLLGGLRDQGLGHKVDSWVGSGENHPVAPHEVERAFDPAEIDEAARRAGTDRGTLLDELSRMLPGMVDKATPAGRMPQRGEEMGGGSGGIGGLLGHLLGGAGGR